MLTFIENNIIFSLIMFTLYFHYQTLGKGLRASLRIGWAGNMLVSPEPKDVAIQKHTHQAWSTRWSGEFSGASRAEAQKVRQVKRNFRDKAFKALKIEKMKQAALIAGVGKSEKSEAKNRMNEGKHSTDFIRHQGAADEGTTDGRVGHSR